MDSLGVSYRNLYRNTDVYNYTDFQPDCDADLVGDAHYELD